MVKPTGTISPRQWRIISWDNSPTTQAESDGIESDEKRARKRRDVVFVAIYTHGLNRPGLAVKSPLDG